MEETTKHSLNPPAFPKTGAYHHDADGIYDSKNQDGMTLRDWFAAHAPSEELDIPQTTEETIKRCGITLEENNKNPMFYYQHLVCKARYAWADAMLKARAL